MRAFLVFLVAAAFASPAFAHTGVGDTSGFVHGFMHPLTGIDHILAMVSVGVFAYVLGGRALILVPLAFVGMMIVGFLLGVAGINLPYVELGIALSAIVIGGAAALGRPLPVAGAMALVGIFATFHGHAHGTEMPATAAGIEFAGGFVLATALLHALGIAAAILVARAFGRHGRLVAQVAGGMFALGGVGILAGWL